MDQLRRFMYGRYGFDQFSRMLIIVTLIISLITSMPKLRWLFFITYLLLAYVIFRTLSRNITRRTQENMAYLKWTGSMRKSLNQLKLVTVGTRTHKYFKCANCGHLIRVPRGKGKICITCPKCRKEFVRRT